MSDVLLRRKLEGHDRNGTDFAFFTALEGEEREDAVAWLLRQVATHPAAVADTLRLMRAQGASELHRALASARGPDRIALLEALAGMDPAGGWRDEILATLGKRRLFQDQELVRRAVEALGRIGDRASVPALGRFLEARDPTVQMAAIAACLRLLELESIDRDLATADSYAARRAVLAAAIARIRAACPG